VATFISYSRVNSDFALHLAKDLKAAGLDVWLDQLDIPTGARWDDEIQKALDQSAIFLIVLSPESIQSQNVKDEIGYAIDSGKHILPVVIKPCNIPFRLRRFQYVDFTNKSYNDSLAEIKHLLTNTDKLTIATDDRHDDAHSEQPAAKLDVAKTIDEKKLVTQDNQTVGISSRSKFVLPVILGGVVIICIAGIAIGIGLILSPSSTPTAALASPVSNPPSTLISSLTSQVNKTEISDSKGVLMRLVPSGSFSMGYKTGDPDTGETTVHTVNVSAFYMDKYLVSNGLYVLCVSAGACQPPVDSSSATQSSYYSNSSYRSYPVIYVNWDMANVYCTWRGARLPSEAEWEKAARGLDGRLYPWGNAAPDSTRANFNGTDTTRVDHFENGKSPYGIYDMAGNVWEWVADWYQANYYPTLGNNASDPLGPDSGTGRVIRGGAWWKSSGGSIRSTLRNNSDPSMTYNYVGFRCARSAP
jgi:sulfatase modifying factor 1